MESKYIKIERTLPLIPLRGLAIFPYTILNFDIILYIYFLQGGNFMNKKKLTLLLVQLEHLLGFLCL